MNKEKAQKHLRLTDEDVEIIEVLRQTYGSTSDNEAIRMAIREALRSLKKDGRLYPPDWKSGVLRSP